MGCKGNIIYYLKISIANIAAVQQKNATGQTADFKFMLGKIFKDFCVISVLVDEV